MDRAFGRRAWAPVDFFEMHDVDPPAASIERGCHCLLFGPKGSGKTTLLFQHALAFVKRDPDARVLFVCRRDSVEASPPLLPQSVADLDAARRISMKYLSTDLELCKLMSVMHILPAGELPNLIVIDDLSGFFPEDAGARHAHEHHHHERAGYHGGEHPDWAAARDRREREMRVVRAVAAASECANQIRVGPRAARSERTPSSDGGGFRGDAERRGYEDTPASTRYPSMLDDEEEEEERSGCLLLASDVSAPGAEAPPLGFLLKKWFKCAVRARETSAREENASREYAAADVPPHANPHAKPRHTGKPYVLERAWVGGGGGVSARELGSNVDRLGAIAYAVDAAGAALADARFVEQRL
jgi:energy-coupling factor transporter ATP-binding protein EcfA2